jgi:hypothetical protein
MRRQGFGGGGQRRQMREMRDLQGDNAAATYFVPSFSVRRHITAASEAQVRKMQREVKDRIGREFRPTPPNQLSIKGFEQRKMIERMRELDKHPNPQDMEDAAHDVRRKLKELLSNAPPTLSVPLGQLGLFGYNKKALGVQIMGWKGYRAQYAVYDDDYKLTPLGTIVEENETCLDVVADSFQDEEFNVEGLAPMPHITIARHGNTIYPDKLYKAEKLLGDVLPDALEFGDPVITLHLEPSADPQTLYVRNARQSLAAR